MKEEKKGFSTRAIHSDSISHKWPGNPVVTGISLSTTFKQEAAGKPDKYEYSRSGNPTRDALENTLAELENAKYALTYASGLAAEANILHLLEPGDEVICCDDVYGG
ncbi:Cystathionine gamma-lyase [Thelohanellus kitauei]|uniref:cystathionine gamma-lyase n=1 Tax=Thelohanellus kitauei TaxID=669202 RepID=A0A0C2MS09_THEKT|nr:Cystathionine gamma-lyase [Thelohanellus kitauei]